MTQKESLLALLFCLSFSWFTSSFTYLKKGSWKTQMETSFSFPSASVLSQGENEGLCGSLIPSHSEGLLQ